MPFLLTADNTTSLSSFKLSDAYVNAMPFLLTAANTTSLSAFFLYLSNTPPS